MIDFKKFYDHIFFDIDKRTSEVYHATQGDTGSRGFYVTIIQDGVPAVITDEQLTAYFTKPDHTRVFINGIKDGDAFRIDITNQVFAVPGRVSCTVSLIGNTAKIADDRFYINVEPNSEYGSIISENEISDFAKFLIDYEKFKKSLNDIIDQNVDGVSELEIQLARRGEANLWTKMELLEAADMTNSIAIEALKGSGILDTVTGDSWVWKMDDGAIYLEKVV